LKSQTQTNLSYEIEGNSILNAYKKYAASEIIKSENGLTIEEGVGDPSTFKERTSDLLINIRCAKLFDFRGQTVFFFFG
jgi:hypothetical protein